MKPLLVCLTLVLALSPSIGWAGDGNAGGHGNNGNSDGNANASGNSQGPHHGGGDSEDALPRDDSVLSPGGLVTIATDQNQALSAVGSGALPLSALVERAVAQLGGRVIDAKLIRRNGALVYRLTMLSDQGVSKRVLYDARSGTPLGGP